MNDVLHEHLDKFDIVYLDDILIFSKNKEEHAEHARIVLELLRKHNLFAKATKCIFFQSWVEFLGYIVGAEGIKADPSKIEAILEWPKPTSIKAVQSFLGFANFYRRFIKNYSKIVAPLTALTKKESKFEWTSKCQDTFELLKHHFTSAPILRHFAFDKPAFVECDASDYAIGSILSQEDDEGILHPVAFDSRKLAPAEMNYAIHDKELLAIFWSFQRWRSYLLGTEHPTIVLTDHNALEYFMSSKQLTRRQARWAEVLSEYNFVIKYRPGKQSEKPDALSRRDDVYPSGGDASYATNNPQNFRPLLGQQSILGAVRLLATARVLLDANFFESPLEAQKKEIDFEALRTSFKADPDFESDFEIRDDGLATSKGKLFVPNDTPIHLTILKMFHDHPWSGHLGRDKTFEHIERHFTWPKSKRIVEDYVASCTTCGRNKTRRHRPYGLLEPLPVPPKPWSSVSMDFIEQLPSSNGYDSILVFVVRLTKMALFIPTHTTLHTKGLAELFIRHVVSKHGLPNDLVSDRGAKFVSDFWKTFTSKFNIKRNLSTAYHPQSDGQTERVNQSLEQFLRIHCAYQQDNWDEWLPLAEIAYNNAEHSSTSHTPFYANYGFHPSFEVVDGLDTSVPGKAYVEDLVRIQQQLREELDKARAGQKRYADKSRIAPPSFEVGSKVYLNSPNHT
jgi:hypothetical protein